MSPTLLPLFYVAWHTAVIYAFLVLGLNVLGRRTMGQLTVIDLVVLVVLGSAVETSMVAGNLTLQGGLMSVATLLVMNRVLTFGMLRSRKFRRFVTGSPILLIHFGHFMEEHLKRSGLTHEDVMQALRTRGAGEVGEVKFAVLEVDGTINVILNEAEHTRTAPLPQVLQARAEAANAAGLGPASPATP